MEYKYESVDGHDALHLQGQFIFADNQRFKTVLSTVEKQPKLQSLRVYLQAVTFMDSAALGMLLLLKDKVEEMGASLTLVGAGGQVKKVLNVTHFDQFFDIAS